MGTPPFTSTSARSIVLAQCHRGRFQVDVNSLILAAYVPSGKAIVLSSDALSWKLYLSLPRMKSIGRNVPRRHLGSSLLHSSGSCQICHHIAPPKKRRLISRVSPRY